MSEQENPDFNKPKIPLRVEWENEMKIHQNDDEKMMM